MDGNTTRALRRDLKQLARVLEQAHTDALDVQRKIVALGINYQVANGDYPADPAANTFVQMLPTIIGYFQDNATTLAQAADIGDNI